MTAGGYLESMQRTQIVPIQHSPLNTAKSHLLVGERVVIVDTGPPDGDGHGQRTRRALSELGRAPREVSLILVTHAHPDHAGNAAALRAWTGAPIAAHPLETAYFEGRDRLRLLPTGLAGRLFLRTPLPHQTYEAFTPDIALADGFDLRAYGVEADVYHCGGHTPGSVAVHVPEAGEILAADLLAGGIGIGGVCCHGRVIEPPFHDDPRAVLRATARLLRLGDVRRIHVCHGGPLHPERVRRWLTNQSKALGLKREELAP